MPFDDTDRDLTDAELRQLEAWLARPPFVGVTMPLDAMQGLFCAVASAPDDIAPSVWLPAVLGDDFQFDDAAQMREVVDLILRFYNATVDELTAGDGLTLETYAGEDDEDDYGLWCLGYLEGVGLSAHDWGEEGDELSELMFPISVLSGVARDMAEEDGVPWPQGDQEKALLAICRDDLVDSVIGIHRYWLARRESGGAQRTSARVEGGDPCPCGSGKPYQSCCGPTPRLH
jgi:uncharacterized protein